MSDLREALEKWIATAEAEVDEFPFADLLPKESLRAILDAHPPAPAQVEITEQAVEVLAQALWIEVFNDVVLWEDALPEEREECLKTARNTLPSIMPFLQPQPVDRPLLDREAVCMQITAATLDGQKGDRDSIDRRTDAVMELARPMPTEAEIERAVAAAGIGSYATIVARAILALLGGVDESRRTGSLSLVCTNCEATTFACTACGARKEH